MNVLQAATSLYAHGYGDEDIRAKLAGRCRPRSLEVLMCVARKNLGMPPRPTRQRCPILPVRLATETVADLREAADARGLAIKDLISQLLTAIGTDDLFAAVLDESSQPSAQQPREICR